VRAVEQLGDGADDVRAGGVGEARQLLEVLLDAVPVGGPLERRPDEQGPLGGGREFDQFASDGGLLREVERDGPDGSGAQSNRRPRHRVPESALNRPVRSYGRVKFPSGVATVKSPTTR
jgi:hypothetical protein